MDNNGTMADTNRYANGKIYRLVNNVDNEEYVGSTCTSLARRKSIHKDKAKKETSRRVYEHLNEIGWKNVDIVLVEEYKCENKMELERRERYYIEALKPSLNKNIPTRTQQERNCEYKKNNAEKSKEYMREYRKQNAEKLKEQMREYNHKNAEKLKVQMRENYWRKKEAQKTA